MIEGQRLADEHAKPGLIGRLFRIGNTIEGVGKLLHRHGWSVQVPIRRALERDERPSRLGRLRCGRQ
ncbi:winged helix-turn-helix domain-containing protein [Nonomuraea sp. NBC_00507]|uniref:helix-turn-helix domain-containing protein n=1 Tax=Nonomuraea sp. NBC_00507 TaxID=2976002 RepID=UPI002E186AEE